MSDAAMLRKMTALAVTSVLVTSGSLVNAHYANKRLNDLNKVVVDANKRFNDLNKVVVDANKRLNDLNKCFFDQDGIVRDIATLLPKMTGMTVSIVSRLDNLESRADAKSRVEEAVSRL